MIASQDRGFVIKSAEEPNFTRSVPSVLSFPRQGELPVLVMNARQPFRCCIVPGTTRKARKRSSDCLATSSPRFTSPDKGEGPSF